MNLSETFLYPTSMRSRYTMVESEGIYFLTATILNWLPVLLGEAACAMVVESLLFCRKNKGLLLYGYVIMENHLHLVAEAPDLSRCMQSFTQFMARELLRLARANGKKWQLHQCDYCKKVYKDHSWYQVWQESSHP